MQKNSKKAKNTSMEDAMHPDRTVLQHTDTQEPLSGLRFAKRELEAKSLHTKMDSLDKAV